MTINGFSSYSSKNLPTVKTTDKAKNLAGQRVAVDTYLLANKARATALTHVVNEKTVTGPVEELRKKVNLETKRVFYERVLEMCDYGWKIIFCFDSLCDGVGRQLKAVNAGLKRETARVTLTDKIAEARRVMEASREDPFRYQDAVKTVVKYEKQNVSEGIASVLHHFRNTLTALGFPSFTPEDLFGNGNDSGSETGMIYTPEGEAVASILVCQGLADIAYTTDADVLSYGCPITITELVAGTFTSRRLDTVLEQIGIDYQQFLTASILAGVDFNTNVYGYAFAKALAAVKSSKVEFIDLLAVQVQQLLTYCYDNHIFCAGDEEGDGTSTADSCNHPACAASSHNMTNNKVSLDWLIKQTSLSQGELQQLQVLYGFDLNTDEALTVLEVLEQKTAEFVCHQKLRSLVFDTGINWFTVLAIYRSTNYASTSKSVEFDYEKFRSQAKRVLIAEGLDAYVAKFCKSLAVPVNTLKGVEGAGNNNNNNNSSSSNSVVITTSSGSGSNLTEIDVEAELADFGQLSCQVMTTAVAAEVEF